MKKRERKKIQGQSRTGVQQGLFLLTCLTCITVGWTGAKYTTNLYALSQEARTAKFVYRIKNDVYKIDNFGNKLFKYENQLSDWETNPGVNYYDLDTTSGIDQTVKEKIQIVFTIELETETDIQFNLSRTFPERSLDIERIELKGEGITPVVVSEPTGTELISYEFPNSNIVQTYTCTLTLRHDGRAEYDWTINPQTGKPNGYLADKYINLIPSFEQID